MLAGWIVATITCTATMIGTANVTVILLRRTGLSKSVRKLLAMGIGQVATASVGSYFLVSSGFSRLFTLPLSRNLALVWVTATVAASLTVVISNRVSGEPDVPVVEMFSELYRVCRPCAFILLFAVAPVCEENTLQRSRSGVVGCYNRFLASFGHSCGQLHGRSR